MKQIVCFCLCWCNLQFSHAQDTAGMEKPFVLGRVIQITSVILNEQRELNIYLPIGYKESDTTRYPVIYLLDGSADEDFIHVAGIEQFLTFPWVNNMPNSIIVGIGNVDRRRDFTFPTAVEKDKHDFPTTGGSGKFIEFIEKELQLFIENRFRTTTSRTIIGQSLGGLLATEILFQRPQLFNKYLIVSPSLWWDNESLLTKPARVLNGDLTDTVSIYVAVGKEGKQMESDVKRLTAILRSGKKKKVKVSQEYFGEEDHASIMHSAVYRGLMILNNTRIKPLK